MMAVKIVCICLNSRWGCVARIDEMVVSASQMTVMTIDKRHLREVARVPAILGTTNLVPSSFSGKKAGEKRMILRHFNPVLPQATLGGSVTLSIVTGGDAVYQVFLLF
jgi:hypothetical protein